MKNRLTAADCERVVDALGIPMFSKSDSQTIYWTGDKNKDPYMGSPKLFFYPSSKTFMGYTAGRSYDLIALVQTRLALLKQPSSFVDALNYILSVTGLDPDACQRINTKQNYNWEDALGKYVRFRRTGSSLQVYDRAVLDELEKLYPEEWIEQGITIDSMEKYGVGYYRRTQATTIPCLDAEGNLIGIRCRHWNPEEIANGKYRPLSLLNGTTYKFPTNDTLYGINYNAQAIERLGVAYLVESEKAVMWLDGLYHEDNVALGLFGHHMSAFRRNQILKLGAKKIVYIPDCDYIGLGQEAYDRWERDVMAFGNLFKGYANVDIVYDNLGLLNPKDNATDAGIEVWNKLYENRETLF